MARNGKILTWSHAILDGKVVAIRKVEKTLPMNLQWVESFDIGSDTLTGVNDADYKPPFPLTAKFEKPTIRMDRAKLTSADIAKLEEAQEAATGQLVPRQEPSKE